MSSARFVTTLPNLVIALNGTTSNAVNDFDDATAAIIYGPAALTGTVTVEVSEDGTTYNTLQSGGSDVTIAAAKATLINASAFSFLRVKSTGAEGSARTFRVRKQYQA